MNELLRQLQKSIAMWNDTIDKLEIQGVHVTASFTNARGEEMAMTSPKIAYRKAVKEIEL